jgi:DNA-binding CsgD family transcriptional regulator
VGLLARRLQTKQIARLLDISAKTADRHIQNAYGEVASPLAPRPRSA